MKRLLLIGSTGNPVHLKNYYHLINDYFDEILIVGTKEVDFCPSFALDFGIKNPINVYKSIRSLRAIMKTFNPSVVHVHQANSVGYIAALANKKRFPHVLTTWGDDVLILPKKNWLYKKLSVTSLKYADAVTADAEIMASAIHEFYKKIPVTIANFGIDLYPNDCIQKENIIYSNRLHDDLYNIDQIILGTASFLKKNSDWKLVIAAIGKNTDKLKQLVQSLHLTHQVEFVGFLNPTENRLNYYKAKYYISIPNTDGTSISLLEAMAYGCVPIVSDLPANREWITDGENGLIVTDLNLEITLDRGMKIDREKAIQLNQEIIQKRATKEANKKKFVAIYDRLLS